MAHPVQNQCFALQFSLSRCLHTTFALITITCVRFSESSLSINLALLI